MLLHLPERNGKIGAMNRGVPCAKNEILVFTDANSMLSENAMKEIVAYFANPKVGCVAGSKQVMNNRDSNPAIGEGVYWKYEAQLKKFESNIGSTIGAAGELFAIRRELFEIVEPDTILDDFVIAMRIALKGYEMKYANKALSVETESAGIAEEMKRKIRIAAGGFQTMFRMKELHSPFKNFMLFFQFYSHKVLRWLVVPFFIIFLFFLNFFILLASENVSTIYIILFWIQVFFYLLAFAGNFLQIKKHLPRWLFFPYYFVVTNYCQLRGLIRFLKGQQTVNWEKAARASN